MSFDFPEAAAGLEGAAEGAAVATARLGPEMPQWLILSGASESGRWLPAACWCACLVLRGTTGSAAIHSAPWIPLRLVPTCVHKSPIAAAPCAAPTVILVLVDRGTAAMAGSLCARPTDSIVGYTLPLIKPFLGRAVVFPDVVPFGFPGTRVIDYP